MNWNGKNVLVTGGTGFLGSWIVRGLLSKGANVTLILRDFLPHKILNKVLPEFEDTTRILGDITDYELVERSINENEIDYVFHLAAQTIVGTAKRAPVSTFNTNIRGTWNILEAARITNQLKGVVIASTDKVYGKHEELPYTEECELRGIYPYDASKVCADVLSRSYFETYDLPVSITRCSNIYGGGDLNFSRIIPATIRSLINKEEPMIRSDGTPERDYTYASDIVSGYLRIAERIDDKRVKGEAFNLGTNNPVSVLNLTDKIIKAFGSSLHPKVLGTATKEIDRQYLSSEKAEKVLGWKPSVSLEQGLENTIEWYKSVF